MFTMIQDEWLWMESAMARCMKYSDNADPMT